MLNKGTNSSEMSWQKRFRKLPLGVRRCGAWVVEVSLIVASGAVPFSIGLYAKEHQAQEAVPLNPVLVKTHETIAQTLSLPIYQKNPQVAPLTNFFWTAALVTPLLVTGWQLYKLGVRGQTLPKQWFGVRVVTGEDHSPGVGRVMLREGGRWGLSAGIAFAIWRYIGAYPDLGVLTGLIGLVLLGDGLSAKIDRRGRSLHDTIAGTRVVDAGEDDRTLPGSFPASPPRWLLQRPGKTTATTGEVGARQNKKAFLFFNWVRQHPRFTVLILFLFSMVVMAGLLVGAYIYLQIRAERSISAQQKNDLFIALSKQISANSNGTLAEKQTAISAAAALEDDPRVVRLLVDLLAQEKEPKVIETIQQVLVRIGLDALPELQRLNQTLAKELDALLISEAQKEETGKAADSSKKLVPPLRKNELTDAEISNNPLALVQLRLRATQEAIVKIISIKNNPGTVKDLSRTVLGQTLGAAPFDLVLDKIDVSGINFQGASLAGGSFQGTRFSSAGKDDRLGTFDDLIADLSSTDLRQANLTGAVLSYVSLENANLIRATLDRANLFEARLTGANLGSAKLIGASLEKAVLEKASLTGADLTEANLSQANLHRASLTRVGAMGAQLQLANLTESDWREADLSVANFNRAILKNANFGSTRLKGTNFNGTQLQNASFRNADLSMADFRGANLEGADFQGAIFLAPKQPVVGDQFIQTPNIATGPRIKGVDFSKVKNLDSEQISYICENGGRHPRCQ
ncbi:pentapeptide repeat-containing protein [Aerosakkonema sp. BLCC-F2]